MNRNVTEHGVAKKSKEIICESLFILFLLSERAGSSHSESIGFMSGTSTKISRNISKVRTKNRLWACPLLKSGIPIEILWGQRTGLVILGLHWGELSTTCEIYSDLICHHGNYSPIILEKELKDKYLFTNKIIERTKGQKKITSFLMVLKFHLLISIHKTMFYLDERFEDLPAGGIFPFDGAAEQGPTDGGADSRRSPGGVMLREI